MMSDTTLHTSLTKFTTHNILTSIGWLTKKACDDLYINRSTYGFGGYGEAGTGLILLIIIFKPGVTKGGQIVLVSDVNGLQPTRTYLHRYKQDAWETSGMEQEARTLQSMSNMMEQIGMRVKSKTNGAPSSSF